MKYKLMKRILFLLAFMPTILSAQPYIYNTGSPLQYVNQSSFHNFSSGIKLARLDSARWYPGYYSDIFVSKADSSLQFYDQRTGISSPLNATSIISPEMYGAKGDGITDDTEPLQRAINAGSNIVLSKNYLITDILLLNNRQNVTINLMGDASIIIQKHGYGVFEIRNSKNITISGGRITGYGSFPSKTYNGGNGGGEKHYVGGTWGFNRNGDSTGRPAFGNGTIGNCGIGVLIHDGSENISIKGVFFYGFNYGGIEVGYRGDSASVRLNFSKNITVEGCTFKHIYNAGVEGHSVDGFFILNNVIDSMGHPDCISTDSTIDPGYGIAMAAVSLDAYSSKNVIVDGNRVTNCNRKCIDSHSSEGLQIVNNTLKQSYIQGISLTGNSGIRSRAIISNNILTNVGIGNILGGVVDGKIGIYAVHDNVTISGNQLYNCGNGRAINTIGDYTIITNNLVESLDTAGKDPAYIGVYFQGGIEGLVRDNIVHGVFKRGFYFGTSAACLWDGNTIDLSLASSPDYAFFNTSNVTIGKNKMPVLQRVVGNSIEPPAKVLNFLFTYSTSTSAATVTPLSGDIGIPYTVSGGGSGTAVVLDIGYDVLAKTSSYIQHNTSYDLTNNPQTYTIQTIASSRYISVFVSPRNAGNTAALASNSGIMNGVKIFLQVSIGGLL